MRRKTTIAFLAVALLVVLGLWLWPRSRAGDSAAGGEATRPSTLAERKEARRTMIEDRTPAVLGGRVVRADDRSPIAGARVALTERGLDFGALGRPGESVVGLAAITDETGRWRVIGVPPGRYQLTATARGFVPGTLGDVVVPPRSDRDDVVLELRAGGHALTGTVSDIGGGPVPAAIVRATPIGKGSVYDLVWTAYTTVTDEDGRYELTLEDGVYGVIVGHVDYREDAASVEIRGGPAVKDFRLTPGGVIHGQVVTAGGGEPVAGALVVSTGGLGESLDSFFISGIGWGGVATDGDGRFVLRGVASGNVELRASAPGYTSVEPTLVQLGIGEQVDGVIVEVDRAHKISGFVVRKGRPDEPVANALVGAWSFQPPAMLAASRPSADDGYFEIFGVPSGRYVVAGAREQLVPNFMATNVEVKDEDLEDVIVELDPGVTLRGRVVPPTRASVHLEIDPESINMFNLAQVAGRALASARTADDGTFELRAVEPGKVKLVATGDDGSEGTLEVEVPDRDVDGLTIPMNPRPGVSGRVVDADGVPLPDVKVRVRPQKEMERLVVDLARLTSMEGAPTAADGTFRVVGLEPGTHEVTVHDDRGQLRWAGDKRGKRTDEYTPKVIEVPEGADVTGLELVVESRGGVIRGVVMGADGQPAADAWVVARMQRVKRPKAKPKRKPDDEEGGKESRRSVTVSVGSEGGSVESSEEEIEEDFDSVRSRRERPVLTDAEGRFEIRDLRDGTYNLEAEGEKGAARGDLDDVALGSDVVIKLERLAGITGVVTYDGNPVTEYSVRVNGPTDTRRYVANREGRYLVNRLEPGTYSIAVVSTRGSVSVDDIEISANKTATKDLSLIPWSSVYGIVVDRQTGEPMPGLAVFAFTEGANNFEEVAMDIFSGQGPRTGDNGGFRIDKLAAGKGTVIVLDGDAKGFQIVASKDFELKKGEDKDLGELPGIPSSDIPRDERGDLGLDTTIASWTKRPLARGADRDADPPSGLDAENTEYLWVSMAKEGGPSEAAGLTRGDRITAVNGMATDQLGPRVINQLMSPLRLRAGDSVTIEYERDGSRTTVTVEAAPLSD